MSSTEEHRPRARVAEARRNRQRLLDSAVRLFSEADSAVPLEAIARAAGVGIGTLYRHFPSRDALVEAVTAKQVDELRSAAHGLLAVQPAGTALRAWMHDFSSWARAKQGMVDSLSRLIATGRIDGGSLRHELLAALALFIDAGARDGSLRTDIDADDLAALLAAILATRAPATHGRIDRLLDLVVDGLRPTAPR